MTSPPRAGLPIDTPTAGPPVGPASAPPPVSSSLPSVLVFCTIAVLVARPPWWSFNYVAALAIAAVALSRRPPRLRAVDTVVLAIGVWAYAGLVWTGREDLTLASAFRYASVGLLFVACRHVVRSSRDLLLVGWAFVAACAVVTSGLIAARRAGGQAAELIPDYALGGTERNATAYTLTTGIVLALMLAAITWRRPLLRFLPLAMVVLLGYGVLLTRCRGAAIGVLLCLLAVLAAAVVPRFVSAVLAALVPALVVLVPIGTMPTYLQAWLDGLYRRPTGDFSGRLSIWPYALSTWWEAPITGSGAGVFIGTNMFGYGPHNLLLTIGNDMGLIGVVLYFGALAAAFVSTARAGRLGLVLACGFAGAMLPIWLSGQWETALAFWLVLAVLTRVPGMPDRRPGPTTPAPQRGLWLWRLRLASASV